MMLSGAVFPIVEEVVKVEVEPPPSQDDDPAEENIGFDDLTTVVTQTENEKGGVGVMENEDGGGEENEEEEEEGEIYEVEAILQERTRRGVKEYFVRWKGYGPEYDTWEPEDNLNCDDIIEEFERAKEKTKSKRGRKRKTVEEKQKPPPSKRVKQAMQEVVEQVINPEEKPKRGRRGRPAGSGSNTRTSQTRARARKESSSDDESDGEPATIVRCKTRFKKYAIEHAIKTEDDRDSDDDNSEDPLKKYFFKYDMEKDKFFVGDLEVEINEESKFFRCSVCKKCGPVWGKSPEDAVPCMCRRLTDSIKNHMIGQHLGGFRCQICDKNQLFFHKKTLRQYQRHMAEVHRRRINMELYDKEDDVEMDEEDSVQEDGDQQEGDNMAAVAAFDRNEASEQTETMNI